MSAQHTPGPWIADGAEEIVTGDLLYCGQVNPAEGEWRGDICRLQSCDHIGGIGREEAAANARLIAAAPRMLECLREAERFMAGFEGDRLQDGLDADLAELRQVISDATGGGA